MRGSPNFAQREVRAFRARVVLPLGKIGSPAPREAAPFGVLDPVRSGTPRSLRLKTEGEYDDCAL